MQIAEIREPHLFQTLVRKLMVSEYGVEYRVVDDSGGDSGLDGFNRATGELHAIYCPQKPDTADYRRKLRSDIEKAARLRLGAGYDADYFIFITPGPLREPLQRELRDYARQNGFTDGINIAADHLEVLLAKHANLLDQFPQLSYPQVQATLGVMSKSLNRIEEALRQGKNDEAPVAFNRREEEKPFSTGFFDGKDYPELMKLQARLEADDVSALYALEQYRLEVTDPVEDLAAASIEIDFEFRRLNLERVISIAATAARRAHRLHRPGEEAVFRAHAARGFVLQSSRRDIDLAASIAVSLRVGFNFVDPRNAEAEQSAITELYAQADAELRKAFSLASEAQNLDAMYFVLMISASCEVHKAIPHGLSHHLGQVNARLPLAKKAVMANHEVAIRIAKLLGLERLAMAYHNYANDLRPLGELERARAHAQRARDLAASCGYDYQVDLSERLLKLLAVDIAEKQGDAATGRSDV